eukprot:tig00020902_g14957.t1
MRHRSRIAHKAHELAWLPKKWPSYVRLVVSTSGGPTLAACQKRAWRLLEVPPLSPGERGQLAGEWEAALGSDREGEGASGVFRKALGYIACSRRGLADDELMALVPGLTPSVWALVVLLAEPALACRSGLWCLASVTWRKAALDHCAAGGAEKAFRLALNKYFTEKAVGFRRGEERTWFIEQELEENNAQLQDMRSAYAALEGGLPAPLRPPAAAPSLGLPLPSLLRTPCRLRRPSRPAGAGLGISLSIRTPPGLRNTVGRPRCTLATGTQHHGSVVVVVVVGGGGGGGGGGGRRAP